MKPVDVFLTVLSFVAIFVLACILLCGCSSPDGVTSAVNYDASFTESERAEIAAGFAKWPKTAPGVIEVVPGTDAKCAAFKADNGKHFDGHSAGNDVSGTICLWMDDIRADGLPLSQIAAHEYGHCLGLQHYEGTEPSVMTPNTKNQATEPQAVDFASLDEVAANHGR